MNGVKRSGPWTSSQVDGFLDQHRIPLRLAFLRADGWPSVVSLWFYRDEATLWCATASEAFVARRLAVAPRCGFEVAPESPPYCGVRGIADARLVAERGDEWRERLAHRYLGKESSEFSEWLLRQHRPETAICLRPRAITSWDYRKRMA